MKVFLRWCAIGFVIFFVASCHSKVTSIPLESKPGMLSLETLFSQLKARQAIIRNVKGFSRTKISGSRLNKTFRQALFVRGSETIRVEIYNLFFQTLGVLIYDSGKAFMYDTRKNQIIQGEEVWGFVRQVMGDNFDFRRYISVFSGNIPRLSHLQAKVLKWNVDQKIYQLETLDEETGDKVIIKIDAYTNLLKSVFLIQGLEEVYRVEWDDYRKVDKWDFAHEIRIHFKSRKETITVKYSDIFINQGFPLNVFKFSSESIN